MKGLFKKFQTHRLQRRKRTGLGRSEGRGLRENSAGDHQHLLHNEFLKITHKCFLGPALIGAHTREIENLSQRGCGICLNIREKAEQRKPGHKGNRSSLHLMEGYRNIFGGDNDCPLFLELLFQVTKEDEFCYSGY